MKFLAVLLTFFALLAIPSYNFAEEMDCNARCRNTVMKCGHDIGRDCNRLFVTECSMKKAICEEKLSYKPSRLSECMSIFDICEDD